jgi:hypothetical protein
MAKEQGRGKSMATTMLDRPIPVRSGGEVVGEWVQEDVGVEGTQFGGSERRGAHRRLCSTIVVLTRGKSMEMEQMSGR